MKNVFHRLITATFIIGSLAACVSCVIFPEHFAERGNGHLVSSERYVRTFEKIYSSGACDVRFYASNEHRVVVTVDENLERFVEVYTKDNALHIKTEHGHSYSFTKFSVDVYCPYLTRVSTSGSGNFRSMDTIFIDNFEVSVSGSGSIRCKVECDDFSAKISGSGSISMSGSSDEASVIVTGSGDFMGNDFSVQNANVSISGSGDAEVWATDFLKARISGSGTLRYRGNPEVDASVTGSGRIREM